MEMLILDVHGISWEIVRVAHLTSGFSPHWEVEQTKSNMYWTSEDQQHARDGECFSANTFYRGSSVTGKHEIENINSSKECQKECQEHPKCNFFTWNAGTGPGRWNKKNKYTCWLKTESGRVQENCERKCNGNISGPKSC